MPEMVVDEKAKKAISDLLEGLGIVKVFCVDDFYAQKWRIEDVLVAQSKLSAERLATLCLSGCFS